MTDSAASRSEADGESAVQHFHEWRDSDEASIGPPSDPTHRFIPLPSLKAFFGERDRLAYLLAAVFPNGTLPVEFSQERVLEHYPQSFAILLSIGKPRYIKHFVLHDELSDVKLPFDSAPKCFPKDTRQPQGTFFNMFYEKQWLFCAPKMYYNGHVEWPKEKILPIIDKQQIGKGGSSITHKIILHPTYNCLNTLSNGQTDVTRPHTNVFVLKTYGRHNFDQNHHHNEVKAFITLRRKRRLVKGLVGFYGSFLQDDEFHIILEYANRGTLENYFHEREPETAKDIFNFWTGLFSVLDALVRLHEIDPSTHGWHQDVNPTNILVSDRGRGSLYLCDFMLADLGLSHFKKGSTSKEVEDKDSRGTRTYGAPECYRHDEFEESSLFLVTSKVDVWSLGAVLSEAATWVVSGKEGLERYRKDRLQATLQIHNFRDCGCFHDGEEVLPFVTTHHEQLRDRARRRCDDITPVVLDLAKNMLLRDEPRPHARFFHHRVAEELAQKDPMRHRASMSCTASLGSSSLPLNPFSEANPFLTTPPLDAPQRDDQWHFAENQRPHRSGYAPAGELTDPLDSSQSRRDSAQGDVADERGSLGIQGPSNMPDDSYWTHRSHESIPSIAPRPENFATRGIASQQHEESSGGYPEPPTRPPPSPPPRQRIFPRRPVNGESQSPRPTYPSTSTQSAGNWTGDGEPSVPGEPNPRHAAAESSRGSINATSEQTTTAKQGWPQWAVEDVLNWRVHKKKDKKLAMPSHEWGRPLEDRDHILLIDDSYSMRPYWQEVIKVVSALGYVLKDWARHGVEMVYTVDGERFHGKKSKKMVESVEQRHPPDSQTRLSDIEHSLRKILENYSGKLKHNQKAIWTQFVRLEVRPLSIYVLTDGVWQGRSNPVTPIADLMKTLDEMGKSGPQVGIQFIQFGNDAIGQLRLNYLDYNLQTAFGFQSDIIDTEPCSGNIWKILLGAINKTLDNDPVKDAGDAETWKALFGIDITRNQLHSISSSAGVV